jgi:transposase
MPRRSPFQIRLTPDERQKLESLGRKYTASFQDVMRAKIILLADEGWSNQDIADQYRLSRQVVSKWRKRFFEDRANGLVNRSRPGHPPVFSPANRC